MRAYISNCRYSVICVNGSLFHLLIDLFSNLFGKTGLITWNNNMKKANAHLIAKTESSLNTTLSSSHRIAWFFKGLMIIPFRRGQTISYAEKSP